MLFIRAADTLLENKLFTWTAHINFTAMDKWELFYPVGLVHFTPWSVQWARQNWVASHRSSKLIGQVGHDKFCQSLLMGIAPNFSVGQDHPVRAQLNSLWKTWVLALVLKIKSRKMSSLPFMVHRKSSLFKICCGHTDRKITELRDEYWALLTMWAWLLMQ